MSTVQCPENTPWVVVNFWVVFPKSYRKPSKLSEWKCAG